MMQFIPVSDDQIFGASPTIGTLVPYRVGMRCQGWDSIEIEEAKDSDLTCPPTQPRETSRSRR